MERIPSDIQDNQAAAPTAAPAGKRRPRSASQASQKIQLRDITYLIVSNWKWFVLSLAICLGTAWLSNKTTEPIYERSASLLIKGKDSNLGDAEAIMQELGAVSTTDMANELTSFRTVATAEQVARRLHLDVDYWQDGTFHRQVLYGYNLPVVARFDSINDNDVASMVMAIGPDSTVTLSEMVFGGEPRPGEIKLRMGQKLRTPVGNLTIEATQAYVPGHGTQRIHVSRTSLADATAYVRSHIRATQSGKSSVIDLSYSDYSPSRAVDVLNTVISVYNENWVKDRNQRTISTNEFIKDRLAFIENELSDVEQDISDYKSENLMPSVEAVGSHAFGQVNAAEQRVTELDNQIYMVRYVRDFLTQGVHDNELLPSSTGMANAAVESQITRYNELLMRRNSHLANSSLQNPLVKDLDNDLAVIRSTILQGLDNELYKLNRQRQSVQQTYGQAVAKVAANPGSAKYLLGVERQQKVKESLYLFLLQKREENELTQAFTAYNNQLIEPPHGSPTPVWPQPKGNLTMALIIGLAVPAVIIFGREFTNTNVRGRKDLENLSVPVLGEIPQHGKPTKRPSALSARRKKKRKPTAPPTLVVKQGSRDVINEAFRVMRTNLELMLGFGNDHHVIMLTSMNPGSGKTFISANLSSIVGALEKRVLVIDLDLRKGSLSRYVGNPRQGVCDYLNGRTDDYHQLLCHMDNVDVLPSGKLPPNPSELLMSKRFTELIDSVRAEYDYVFLDCPPVEIVADTAIINRVADRTIFVVRAGLLDRDSLPDIDKWYDEDKYNGLCILLNGTSDAFSHYGYHRYGSRYGYSYGHYGYGYQSDEEEV